MARLPVPGSDDGTWGTILNDFLSVEHNADGTQKTLDVAKGGTGATTDSGARTNLGLGSAATASTSDFATAAQGATADAAIPKSIIDAKGDIISATASDTPARLAVGGTDGHVLKVASAQATGLQWAGQSEVIIVAVSDETTDITAGTSKVAFRMPFAMTLTSVRASLTTSGTGSTVIDVNEGAGAGTTILSTKITIETGEETSLDAVSQPVISDASLADDARITVDIDTAGTGAKGLKVSLIGTRA